MQKLEYMWNKLYSAMTCSRDNTGRLFFKRYYAFLEGKTNRKILAYKHKSQLLTHTNKKNPVDLPLPCRY